MQSSCMHVSLVLLTVGLWEIRAECGLLTGGLDPFHVTVTGHSLGGAVAAISASWFALQYPGADVTCITFGTALYTLAVVPDDDGQAM